MESWREELYDSYLSHHGIEGQKWGNRNGPPYPLDYNDHSAAEKRFLSRPKNVISGIGKIERQGEGLGTGPLGNRGASGGGGISSESDKELIDYLSEITGMKKKEIAKLLALYKKKGVDDPTFLSLLSDLSEGDSKQSKKILDAIKAHYSSKTMKSNSSIEENISSMTGMKKEEISKLLALYEKKGVNDPTFLRMLSDLSEGDSKQSKKILDTINEHYSSKTTKPTSGIKENISNWVKENENKLISGITDTYDDVKDWLRDSTAFGNLWSMKYGKTAFEVGYDSQERKYDDAGKLKESIKKQLGVDAREYNINGHLYFASKNLEMAQAVDRLVNQAATGKKPDKNDYDKIANAYGKNTADAIMHQITQFGNTDYLDKEWKKLEANYQQNKKGK